MAYQHFYSRVPARVSIFNKIDGFDTFAHSAELDRAFILGELPVIYYDKLNKNNPEKIRRREIPTVYSQIMLPSGRTVQSALTYLPLDYTRERSSYLVHSLVLTDAERSAVFANPMALSFNPEMFVTDIAPFNLTAPTAQPNPAYPAGQYAPRPVARLGQVSRKYHPEMLARLIFAVVHMLSGSGKQIFVRLPVDDKRLSIEALELVNALLNVLPYNLRELVSFVTYVSDYNNYPEFNLKFVSSDCPAPPASRGIFFDFAASTISGMGNEIEANRPLVGFLYSLLDNPTVRNAFHIYVARILATYTDKTLGLATLNELVFLFWQCSGFYVEQSVLPNDEMLYEYFSVYERYRDALSDEYRKQAYKTLERYSKSHTPIPERIFSKLCTLYPGDSVPAKRQALTVALHIIHTDVMREQLFGFISSNYEGETDEVKAIVNEDLSRVFYGGFLQGEILSFFDKHFDSSTIATQNVILQKLLLAIRTPEIQERIVSFIDDHYDRLAWEQKVKVYATAMEMIPECDRLSSMLVWLMNRHIEKEREELRETVASKIAEYLAADYQREMHLLLPILVFSPGFIEDVVIRLVCTHWKDSVVNYEYTQLLNAKSSYEKVKKLTHVYNLVENIEPLVFNKLLDGVSTILLDTAATLYDFISLEQTVRTELAEAPAIADMICDKLLYPTVIYSLYDVFRVKYGKDGIDTLTAYASGKPAITESAQYAAVLRYTEFTGHAADEDTTAAFTCVEGFPLDARTRVDISDHIRMCALNRSTQSAKTAMIYELCINYLKTGNFRFDVLYQNHKKSILQKLEEEAETERELAKADKAAAIQSIELVIECTIEICSAGSEYADLVCDEASGFAAAMKSFIITYGLGVGRFLKQKTEFAHYFLIDIINDLVKEYKPQGTEIFTRLIGKN